MQGECRIMSLREAGVQLLDCEHRTPPPAETGYPYIAIPQVKDGRLDLSDARLISPQHFSDWTRKARPREWDVILSRRCNPGETAVVPAGLECALGQNLVLLRADGKHVHPELLRWLVRSPAWWHQINAFINVGAVFDSLKCADIPKFQLPIPPLADQRTISEFLGALDDKIELNRQMNETLEAMARALFKSWFIDFDPVRAKAEGRDPGLPPAIADLFLARLTDSELGEIPNGWVVGALENTADLLREQTNPFDFPDTVFHHYSIPAFDNEQHPIVEQGDAIKSMKFRVRAGTILLSKLNPEIERVWIADPTAGEEAVCSTEFLVLRPRLPFGRGFLYCLLRSAELREAVRAVTTGTSNSHQRARVDSVLGISISLAPEKLVNRFEVLIEPMIQRGLSARREARTLAALRDALLPKLISGEIRVKEAERLVAEAAA
jgi:type I restriction enzyme S subunit